MVRREIDPLFMLLYIEGYGQMGGWMMVFWIREMEWEKNSLLLA